VRREGFHEVVFVPYVPPGSTAPIEAMLGFGGALVCQVKALAISFSLRQLAALMIQFRPAQPVPQTRRLLSER
jgi:hypothetical protein